MKSKTAVHNGGSETGLAIPPLSQSRYENMACETLYAARHIAGLPDAESAAAQRGSAIHAIMARYVKWLAGTHQKTDYNFLEALVENAAPEVAEVIEKVREGYQFEPDQVLGTEMRISLNEDFRPLPKDYEGAAAYEGTLDLVLLMSQTEAEIRDGKSYFQIIAADTFQSKFYPLLLMCVMPSLESVRFVLDFWRYGAEREVTYTRGDLPKLKKLAQAQRARQLELHASTEDRSVSPGRHCMWCPLLLKGCPMEQTNPYATMTPRERVSFAIWLKEASAQNNLALKNMMVEGGPISVEDGNGTEYRAEFVPQLRKSYPLAEASAVIADWVNVNPDDAAFTARLTVGGLRSPLKAKKRAEFATRMEAVAETRCITKLKVGKPGEDEEENGFEE